MISSLPPIAGSAPTSHPLTELAKQLPMSTSLDYDDSVKDDTNSSDAVVSRIQRPMSYSSRITEHHKFYTHHVPLKSSLSSRIQKKDEGGVEVTKGDDGGQREHVRWQDGDFQNPVDILEDKQELEKVRNSSCFTRLVWLVSKQFV